MNDEYFMREAMAEAARAAAIGDIPVGAVAVYRGEIVARACNQKESQRDPTAHAELLVIRETARVLGGWRLSDVTVYCTLEPCPMCAGAMVQARLAHLVYAVADPKAGAAGSVVDLLRDSRFNHVVDVRSGVLEAEVAALMSEFFTALRAGNVTRWSRWAQRKTTS